MNDDPLHPNATLSRLIKCPKNYTLQGIVEIGIFVDYNGSIAAQFENNLFLARLGLQGPTHIGRSSERQQF